MRAAVLTRHGGLDALEVHDDWPVPSPGTRDVLLRVGACGLNATDLNTRVGWYTQGEGDGAWAEPMAFPRIQGADVCGEVVAVGAGVPAEQATRLLGRRVLVDPWLRDLDRATHLQGYGYLGSERDGGYAEYVAVPAANAHAVSSSLTDVELASFATSAGTARMARSQPRKAPACTASTRRSSPRKGAEAPAARPEPRARTEATGRSRSSSTSRTARPTAPVAPSRAMRSGRGAMARGPGYWAAR